MQIRAIKFKCIQKIVVRKKNGTAHDKNVELVEVAAIQKINKIKAEHSS